MIFKSYLINNVDKTDSLYEELIEILSGSSEYYESDINDIKLKNELETDLIIILDRVLNEQLISIFKHLNFKYPTIPVVFIVKNTDKKLEQDLLSYNLVELLVREDCSINTLTRSLKFFALHKKNIETLKQNEVLETIQQFSGAVAHEFRQPLQVIAGYLQILEMKVGDSQEIKKSKEMIQRIEKLINILNNINKVESKDYTSRKKIMDLVRSSELPGKKRI